MISSCTLPRRRALAARVALVVGALVLGVTGCAKTGDHRMFWAHPDNLSGLRVYEYGLELEGPPEERIDCGKGRVARVCPTWDSLPHALRARLLARRALGGAGTVFAKRDPVPQVVGAQGRRYFLAPYEETVFAMDAATEAPLWASKASLGYDCEVPLVFSAGRLYFVCRHNLGRDQSVFAMDGQTGQPVAAFPLESQIATLVPWPGGALAVLADGALFALGGGGEGPALVGQLEGNFHRLFDPLPGPIRVPAPSVSTPETLYLGGARAVWALRVGTGALLWKRNVEAQVRGLLADGRGERLFVATGGTRVLFLDSQSGEEAGRWEGAREEGVRWFLATFGPPPSWDAVFWAAPPPRDGQLVFCDYQGICYGVDTGAGRLRWAIKAGPRYRQLRPFVGGGGGRLLIDLPPERLLLVPGLPLSEGEGPSSSLGAAPGRP